MIKKINFIAGIICLIDPWFLEKLAQLAGFIFYLISPAKREIARKNVDIITGSENKKLVLRIFINIIMNIIEFLRVWRLGIQSIIIRTEIQGFENFSTDGQGVILVTGHIGIWDIAAKYLAHLGYNIGAVAEFKGVSASHYDFMLEIRGYPEVKIFPLEDYGISGKILRFLKKEQGILALLGDRDLHNTGETVRFFNEIVKLPVGPARLAVRLNLPVVIGYVVRSKSWRYLAMVSKPLSHSRCGDREKDIKNLHEKIAKSLENVITKYPDQWLNFYPPWKMDEK
ncbi:MAG: hypothetical protein APR63_06060 [Desulfuromonas sp. SDB]|nr:MAG: hypothetical protein APR63_06060 [Desulfuromonas sp. SDB]